jgi:tRNA uridine 5-carboxymethylaminomethyl modification enzyme
VVEEMITSLIVENKICLGVKTLTKEYKAKCTIITTGTYMEAKILIGHTAIDSGPEGDAPSIGLSKNLQDNDIDIFRLKTGTPPRIITNSIDFSKMEKQPGTLGNLAFSYSTKKFIPLEEQAMCYLIHTTEETKKIINANLKESSMYGGLVTGVGPRYCPSIEDKVVRFSDKEKHQLFLEPESKFLDTTYLQGLSTSMPKNVQEKMVKSLPGLENAIIKKYAYAIEYDAIVPTQLWPTLELKEISNLFSAGQINGTSGYEEAAGQGLIAGINAAMKIKGKDPLILRRDEAYIGVMIDDLITKGTNEPYRLLTSRAEYRLLLRHDNADLRLKEYGYNVGLVSENEYALFLKKKADIEECINVLKNTNFSFKHPINDFLKSKNIIIGNRSVSASNLVKRSNISLNDIKPYIDNFDYEGEVIEEAEIQVKYEGYIAKQIKEAENNKKLESLSLPKDIDYNNIDNLAIEARQKLNKIKPVNIGQASRISGVNPSDISILLMLLKERGIY